MDEVYDFGLQLKRLRIKKKLTQKQVGELIGVSKKAISGYERNVMTPSFKIVIRLALLYGVSIDSIAGLEERTIIYLDDLPEKAQRFALDMIDRIKQDYRTSEDKSKED